MSFHNRIRLPLYIKAAQFPTEANRFRLADGSTKTLSVVIRKTYNLVTDYMPERMHQRLTIALNHDVVTIEGTRYVGGVSVDGEYKIDWQDFLDYPLAPAEVQIQATPFAATNDNCQTCEELSQVITVDDIIPVDINEGEIANLSAYDNDTICCSPVTAEIVYINTTFVDSATINPLNGSVLITIKDPSPSSETIKLATYRVTCPDGRFDEADIFGSVSGSLIACPSPDDLLHTNISDGEDQISWTDTGDFEWELFDCDNLGTPVQTGTSSGSPQTFLNLTPGGCYVFSMKKICGVDFESGWGSVEFNVPASEDLCGEFTLTNNEFPDEPTDFVTYMNCAGVLTDIVVKSVRTVCMLTDTDNTPHYFESENGFVTYNFEGPC